MTYQVMDNGVVRDATPDEIAEIEARQEQITPVEVPESVTRRQAIQVLINHGLSENVQPIIDALDDGTPEGLKKKLTAQNEWNNATEFLRDHPLVINIATALGLDSDTLDAMFIEAATL